MRNLYFYSFGIGDNSKSNLERMIGYKIPVVELDFHSRGYRQSVDDCSDIRDVNFITDNPTYLQEHDLWYDELAEKWNIYFVKDSTIKHISELTDKWIQPAHNIMKMFLNGAFDTGVFYVE